YELLAPVFRNREILQEVEKAGGVRERENVIQQKPRILVDPAGWNPVVRERLSRRRIEDGLPNPVRLGREIAVPHRFGRRGGANDLGLAAPAPLLREEEERLVPVPVVEPGNDNGPADAITKIIEAPVRPIPCSSAAVRDAPGMSCCTERKLRLLMESSVICCVVTR